MSTSAQIAANQANSKLSTGPVTPEGRAHSSQNALKTGLTGRTVVLPGDNTDAFSKHVAAYFAEYQPEGLRENELVQSLAETRWRLNRIFSLESALLARAPELEDGLTPTPLDAYLLNEKTLRNLHLQENRLNRRFDKDLVELRTLQQKRREDHPAANSSSSSRNESLDAAAQLYIIATQTGCLDSFVPSQLGFEFSIDEIKRRVRQLAPKFFSGDRAA